MASNFPVAFDSLSNPLSSDLMNSQTVPHAAQHSRANDAIEALQAKVGIDDSLDPESIDYRLVNHNHDPDSSNLGSVSGAVALALTSRTRHFRLTQAGITTLTFTGLGVSGVLTQFHFELTTTATLYTLNLPAGWKWDKNTTPTFAISKTYVIAAETFDGGTTGRFYLASEF